MELPWRRAAKDEELLRQDEGQEVVGQALEEEVLDLAGMGGQRLAFLVEVLGDVDDGRDLFIRVSEVLGSSGISTSMSEPSSISRNCWKPGTRDGAVVDLGRDTCLLGGGDGGPVGWMWSGWP